jgi:succinate dehydrogenase flavin-adding protein (antitoxin of CptAB toxin-antitoxin module)
MAKLTVVEDRLRIAGASFRGARERHDDVLTEFWSKEVDRLLDAKLRMRNALVSR